MDILALNQRLYHAEVRKLLLIIGLVVAVIIVFQFSALPYGKALSAVTEKLGSVAVLVSNANTSNNVRRVKTYAIDVMANETYGSESEVEVRHAEASSFVKNPDKSFHKLVSPSEFTREGNGKYGTSSQVRHITITSSSSTQEKGSETQQDQLVVEHPESTVDITDPRAATSDAVGSILSAEMSRMSKVNSNSDVGNASFTDITVSSLGIAKHSMKKEQKLPQKLQISLTNKKNYSSGTFPLLKEWRMQPISISQMNSKLLQSAVSSHAVKPRWSSARDRELLSAKLQIDNAPILRNSPLLSASVYRNLSKFKRSYELMERTLKVYVYKEGAKPIFHQPKMRGIYASEGWFMKLMEGYRRFLVKNPKRAHLFYLPISIQMLRTALTEKTFQRYQDLQEHLGSYVQLIAGKYNFWNRTRGADHFIVACHDWAPKLTKNMKSCIRVLCNANAAKDFKIGKDTTLPVTYIRSAKVPLEDLGGRPPSERPFLAFFAGSIHGYLRPILLQHWENRESDIKIVGPMPRDAEGKKNYREHMKSSRYCICARGYEVHTPRVVEAIFHECVPVIISDNYVPPFLEVLNWEAFSVFIQEQDIPNLRNILLSIPEEKYLEMHAGIKMVQQHFLWHQNPLKYDLFHMILHSVWYNRIFHWNTR